LHFLVLSGHVVACQRPEVQDIADFVGDSLGLARKAAATKSDVIVFCGVHFMAETSSILSPEKKVLIPDLEAGCSLADTITAEELRRWKKRHPGVVVVSYVNTPADVKAESDYCCTSTNAVKIVNSIPSDKEVLLVPDIYLGAYVERMTGRRMHLWPGQCHVHAKLTPQAIKELRHDRPNAEFLIHPECGCITNAMYYLGEGKISGKGTQILSTSGMLKCARTSTSKEFIVATETGILHQLTKQNPGKQFFPAREDAVCEYMKMITLEKVHRSLREMIYEVKVPAATAAKARVALERMVSVS
jgi:quinolinate synthase